MANGLLDLLGGAFGTSPPDYMQGLLGADAVENLRKRSIGSGLVNALIGYAAAPKNQNLGLGRILASAAQSGIQGARGVYDNALGDYQTTQKIEDMKSQRALQMQKLEEQQQIKELAPKLIRDVPAVTEYEDEGYAFMPAPQGETQPNFNLGQSYTKTPIEREVSPARRELDMGVLKQIMGASSDPLGALKTSAELVPALRKAGMFQTGAVEDNPFLTWSETATSPQVKKLANQYAKSFANGTIDLETADKRIADLAKAEDTYVGRKDMDSARKEQNDRDYELQSMLANNQISQSEFNRQIASNAQGMRQDAIDQKRAEADRRGQKVLPGGAFKLESEDISTGYETVQLANEIDNQIKSLITNKVDFSPAKNVRLATLSAIGSKEPEVLAYNDFIRFKTKLVNDSLRLNKGTQTEGDAIRSANELSKARSTQDAVSALQKMNDVNTRAVQTRNQIINSRRKSGGLTEERGYVAPEQILIPKYQKVFFNEKDPKFIALPKGTEFIDGNTGLNKVK
jgi:hypothetical protein